eukprot:CAMPEP_0178998628 /NCGR_PEP_ID=MMETSP0795-20121207/9614_1 /TAXON_ID=88552 /ORGANISM="Amoebophrya sp., Strain Ameob2" /LENGTH=235 /DNA_ID=CAMNT_0020691319 /DNA_START=8 /DNA_END=715 /DNA_ORIENTATION=+
MIEQDVDTALKVIVVGNGQVGKTSMITRFAKGVFTDSYKKTLAVDFLEKRQVISNEEITFLLWDTAGQEEYDAITRGYYRGAGCCIIAFSTTDRDSFDAVPHWYDKVREECGNIVVVLAQNKVDLLDEAKMSPQEVEALASRLHLKLYRVCVKDNLNVSEIFGDLGMEYLKRGGERGLGVSAVASMASTGKASASQDAEAEEKTENNPFQLTAEKKPSVQRTGGKKKRFASCAIL